MPMRTAGILFLGYVVLAWLAATGGDRCAACNDTDRSGWFIFMPFLAYLVTAIGGVALTILTGGAGGNLRPALDPDHPDGRQPSGS